MITTKNALTRYPYINLTMYFDENKKNQEKPYTYTYITNHRANNDNLPFFDIKIGKKGSLPHCCCHVCDTAMIYKFKLNRSEIDLSKLILYYFGYMYTRFKKNGKKIKKNIMCRSVSCIFLLYIHIVCDN